MAWVGETGLEGITLKDWRQKKKTSKEVLDVPQEMAKACQSFCFMIKPTSTNFYKQT